MQKRTDKQRLDWISEQEKSIEFVLDPQTGDLFWRCGGMTSRCGPREAIDMAMESKR